MLTLAFFALLSFATADDNGEDNGAAGAEELLTGDVTRSVSDGTGVGTAVGMFTNKGTDTYRTLITVTVVSGEGTCEARLITSGSPTPVKSCVPADAACAMEVKPAQHVNLWARARDANNLVMCSAVMKYESR